MVRLCNESSFMTQSIFSDASPNVVIQRLYYMKCYLTACWFFPSDSFYASFYFSRLSNYKSTTEHCLLCASRLPPQQAAHFCVSLVPSYSKNWCNVLEQLDTPSENSCLLGGEADCVVEEEFVGFLRSLSFSINYLPQLVRHRSSRGSPPPNFRVGSNRFQSLMSLVF